MNYIGIEICLSFINLCLYIPKPNEYTEEVYSFLDNIKVDGKYYRMINETDKQNFSKTSNKSLFDTISEIYQEGKKLMTLIIMLNKMFKILCLFGIYKKSQPLNFQFPISINIYGNHNILLRESKSSLPILSNKF